MRECYSSSDQGGTGLQGRKRCRGDERETWYIGQILHYGLGSGRTTKAAAPQRLVEASKTGKLKVPRPILDIEKRLKDDYNKKSGTTQRFRIEKKEVAPIAPSHIRGIDIGYSDQETEDKETESWYSFHAGDINAESDMCEREPLVGGKLAVEESSWVKEYETERRAKIQRRQDKYKVGRIKTPVNLDS